MSNDGDIAQVPVNLPPQIEVHEADTDLPPLHRNQQQLLSPGALHPARPSLDVPPSPTPTFLSNDGTISVPPSPTLSNKSSVHFQTSLALRDNKPEAASGMGSLALLSPDSNVGEMPAAHLMLGKAVFRPCHNLMNVKSNTTSLTHVDGLQETRRSQLDASVTSETEAKAKKMSKKERKQEAEKEAQRAQLEQDKTVDPTPFAFRPYELAHMLDPKSFDTMRAFGGSKGLLKGLGTSATRGLKSDTLKRTPTRNSSGLGAGEGTSHRHDPEKAGPPGGPGVPGIMLTDADGESGRQPVQLCADGGDDDDDDGPGDSGPAFEADMATRRAVYGENLLPHRPSKSLFRLMWDALQDKVLIMLSVAAVISLALGFLQDFGPSRDPTEPPVDWVEGVAIIVAIAIVVLVGSLNDWQKERQFQVLNEKKDERFVKVIRNGIEHLVDIKVRNSYVIAPLNVNDKLLN
ncbi:plasma membrane calcium [Pleurotus ostreatus]|nr:plasma membrane calcium [Pleurotus ostreatus]